MSRRSVTAVTIVALALAGTPAPVWGQALARAEGPAPPPRQAAPLPAGDDTVTLRDGTVLQGKILEFRPERGVTIALAEGTRTIAWQDLVSTSFSRAPAAASETQTQAAAEPVPAGSTHEVVLAVKDEVPPGPSRPRIFIEAPGLPDQVHLIEVGGAPRFSIGALGVPRSVCRAPCGRVIDGSAGRPFYFGGNGLAPSKQFFLKDVEGEYVARVRPGRPGFLVGGLFAMLFGLAGTAGGSMLFHWESIDNNRSKGGALLGVGLGLLAAGITLLVHGTTRYRLYRRR